MSQPQQAKRFFGFSIPSRVLTAVVAFVALMLVASIGVAPAAAAHSVTGKPGAVDMHQHAMTQGKAPEVHDSRWLSLKLAYRVTTPGGALTQPSHNGSGGVHPNMCIPDPCPPPPPSAKTLSTTVVQNTLEPWGRSNGYTPSNLRCTVTINGTTYTDGIRDDNNNCYRDQYYWSFCGPGAVDSALYYWNGNTDTYPAGSYTEPSYAPYHQTTYWTSSDHNRSYLMYIAEVTKVPTWSTAGMVTFGTYSNAGTYLSDITNTLNWEASGHNTSTWQNYWYLSVSNSGLTASTLNADIVTDIADGYPVVAEVNTTNLPNWNTNGIIHYITIIGYDNNNHTYTYVDSCGTACGSTGAGVHTINQSTADQYGNSLLAAIVNVGSGGGFSW